MAPSASLSDPPASPPARSSSPSRLPWVDNLRTVMIALVVNMHACVTYSHVGSWYRMEDPEPGMPVKLAFIFWQAHLQAFFMGLLFFLAGAFAHHSLQRRGPGSFVWERTRRLGLPSLLYMLLIHPFMVFVLLAPAGAASLGDRYGGYLTSGRFLSSNGPLWFALALWLFCIVLAGWRWRLPEGRKPAPTGSAPGTGVLIGFGVLLSVGTFLVRLVQPVGTDVLNFQLAFFPQYIAAFVVGVAAGRQGWLEALANSRCARWAGWVGCLGGPLFLAILAGIGGAPPEDGPNPYSGGWQWQALGYAAWEQLTGLALGLGALAWFRRHGRWRGRVAEWLSARSFAVYVLHAPILVALTPLVRPAAVNPFAGATVLTCAGLVVSFLAADFARRLPGLRQIL